MYWYYARFILEGVSSKAAISGLEVVLMDDEKEHHDIRREDEI